jgi:hypothetical protein
MAADAGVLDLVAPMRLRLPALTAAVLASTLAVAPAVGAEKKRAKRSSAGIHNGAYTCYQGGLTSTGSAYWGTFKVTKGKRYAITGSKGTFRRRGARLIWKSGSLKKWKWTGRYRTSRTPAGERQWHVEIIDRPNEIKITCSD